MNQAIRLRKLMIKHKVSAKTVGELLHKSKQCIYHYTKERRTLKKELVDKLQRILETENIQCKTWKHVSHAYNTEK